MPTRNSHNNEAKAGWNRLRLRRARSACGLASLCLVFSVLSAGAATFTASLDRDTMTLGETVTLSLTFEGASLQGAPNLPPIPNLRINNNPATEFSSHFDSASGQSASTFSYKFTVTPLQAGDFTIPGFTINLGGEKLSSQPLTLRVMKPNAPPPQAINSGSQLAFLRLLVPKKEIYVGETVPIQLELWLQSRVRNVGQFQLTSFPSDGFNMGKMAEGQRRQTQIGNTVYTVIPLLFPLTAVKAGAFTIGPAAASVVVSIPSSNRDRDFMDPFGMFERTEQRPLTLASESENLQALALPTPNAPPDFNGAVGSYSMTLTAGPTNLTAGDPITVRIQISGRGAVDSLNLPEQTAWRDFKTYPPNTKVETTDQLGLQGTKSFEQIVVPQSATLKELPPVSFSFFDPETKGYRTLTQPAVPLLVRPGEAGSPTVLAATRGSRQETPLPAQDIIPNKQRLGALAQAAPPLVQQPWFLAVQSLPVLAFVSAFVWRKRTDSLAHNPRLRRQRHVARLVREGLLQLQSLASQNKSDDFFAVAFHLLQEQLGERLDLPASAITEAVLDEELRPRRVPETIINPLLELFQTCNLARYAPVKSSQELAAIIPGFETVLRDLQALKL